MKRIALMMTYNNVHFFKRSLAQALDFCDEVIVVEGAHLKGSVPRSTDGTCAYLKTLSNPKLKLIQDFKPEPKYKPLQHRLRKTYARESKYWKEGNWIMQWDDDIFFFNNDLVKIDKAMRNSNYDTIVSRERRFAYNFKFSVLSSKIIGAKWHRITKDCYYKPIAKLCYKGGGLYIERKGSLLALKGAVFHHYTFVRLSDRVKLRWELSVNKGERSNKNTYDLWKGIKWDNDKDLLKQLLDQEDSFRKVIGGRGKIEIYNGRHPEVLHDHPWAAIDDVRKIK